MRKEETVPAQPRRQDRYGQARPQHARDRGKPAAVGQRITKEMKRRGLRPRLSLNSLRIARLFTDRRKVLFDFVANCRHPLALTRAVPTIYATLVIVSSAEALELSGALIDRAQPEVERSLGIVFVVGIPATADILPKLFGGGFVDDIRSVHRR